MGARHRRQLRRRRHGRRDGGRDRVPHVPRSADRSGFQDDRQPRPQSRPGDQRLRHRDAEQLRGPVRRRKPLLRADLRTGGVGAVQDTGRQVRAPHGLATLRKVVLPLPARRRRESHRRCDADLRCLHQCRRRRRGSGQRHAQRQRDLLGVRSARDRGNAAGQQRCLRRARPSPH